MSLFFNADDGFYTLTPAGIIAFIVIAVIFLVLAAFLSGGISKEKKKLFFTKQLVFSAVMLALGFATSYVQLIKMPWGGSVTLFSMLFITLIGYWYGPKIGLSCAFAYGIMQFLQGGGTYILSPMQACLDYFFAFAALGVSSFFYKKKNGLIIGYIVAILARGLFHTIGGYIYWMDYMPESFPSNLAAIYPICYNYAYILLEGVVTVIVLLLPPVKKAMSYAKRIATEQ